MVSDRDVDVDVDADADADADADNDFASIAMTLNAKRTLAYCEQQHKRNGSDSGLPRTALHLAHPPPARTFCDHILRHAVSRICLWR